MKRIEFGKRKRIIKQLQKQNDILDRKIYRLERSIDGLKYTNEQVGKVLFNNYSASIGTAYPGPELKDQFKL